MLKSEWLIELLKGSTGKQSPKSSIIYSYSNGVFQSELFGLSRHCNPNDIQEDRDFIIIKEETEEIKWTN